jgi:hypothetical protein
VKKTPKPMPVMNMNRAASVSEVDWVICESRKIPTFMTTAAPIASLWYVPILATMNPLIEPAMTLPIRSGVSASGSR